MKKLVFLIGFIFINLSLFSQEDAWVYLTDKQNVASSIANPITILSQKAINRKNLHNIAIDERDVPVNENYITQLKNAPGITVMAKSKWFNAVHVRGNETNINNLKLNLTFVNRIDFANKNLNSPKPSLQKKQDKLQNQLTNFNYGNALNQIEMFKGDKLHLANYTGTGMTVAVLDAGFPNVNTMLGFKRLRDAGNLLGSYDFVNRDTDVYTNTSSNHGTLVLSNMAGYIENQFVGTAPDASYYLFITENAPNENPVEESYWVEAAERADSLGVDVINTSLGYTTYDNPLYSYSVSDMNGNTAFITKGANIAFEKGMLLVNSAGNSGNTSWQTLGAPADAQGVLTIGAVNASGNYAYFSSRGNAFQPTHKPDVVAQGQSAFVITQNDAIATASGTSFSSPILAGGVVCLWQAMPTKTNAEIMQLVRESASQYLNPDYLLGYGIPNLEAALNSVLTTGVNSDSNQSVLLFPNPANENIFIKLPNLEDTGSLQIFDVSGKMLGVYLVSYQNNQVPIETLSNGVYIIKVIYQEKPIFFKIVKH